MSWIYTNFDKLTEGKVFWAHCCHKALDNQGARENYKDFRKLLTCSHQVDYVVSEVCAHYTVHTAVKSIVQWYCHWITVLGTLTPSKHSSAVFCTFKLIVPNQNNFTVVHEDSSSVTKSGASTFRVKGLTGTRQAPKWLTNRVSPDVGHCAPW